MDNAWLKEDWAAMYAPWVKAIDLEQWAPKQAAASTLPALVRRLIWATTSGQRTFSFPAGESVARPGWDGRLDVERGNVWVPDGESRWEFSAGVSPAQKANENYEKRTEATPAEEAAKATFVFVTPHKWIGRATWVAEKMTNSPWRDVQVLDSDELEHWLEKAPAVDVWLARIVGKITPGVRDLSSYWELVAALTTPALPSAAFLAGRAKALKELIAALLGPPREIPIPATSEQELIDFIAASIGEPGEHDPLPARVVLVDDKDGWNQMTASTEPLVLVPAPGFTVDRTAIAQAVRGKHHVITRRPFTPLATVDFRLPRAWRYELQKALLDAGFPEERAIRLANECGGQLSVLQRLATPGAGTALPPWAQEPHAAQILPFVLLGAWEDGAPGDNEVVAKLTGLPYEKALALIAAWEANAESPFRRVGSMWGLTSREDAWIHLAPLLTRADLERFAEIAVTVLSEHDPRFDLSPGQRAFASIAGKIPRFSDALREGIAETLAMLGTDLVPLPAISNRSGVSCARSCARRLLPPLGTPLDRWFALSPNLVLLAEASPEEILEAVERDLESKTPVLPGLFESDEEVFMGTSIHHHLVRALALLAWDPAYLTRVTLALAKLAVVDPGGRTHPRPKDSLVEIFLPWFPHTGATAAERCDALEYLIDRERGQAWELLKALVPKNHEAASAAQPPRWRQWPARFRPNVPPMEIQKNVAWIAAKLVDLAAEDLGRLLDLIDEISGLPAQEFSALVAHLERLAPNDLPATQRLALWTAIREKIQFHEVFDTAVGRLSEARIAALRRVEERLRPQSPAERGRWLFQEHHVRIGPQSSAKPDEQAALALEQRKVVLSEIFRDEGMVGLAEFAKSVDRPGLVGAVLARTTLWSDPEDILRPYLGNPDASVSNFARGFAEIIFFDRGWGWVDGLPLGQWDAAAAAQLLRVLPFGSRTWGMAERLGLAVKDFYWSSVQPQHMHEVELDGGAQAVSELLAHGRPLEALEHVDHVYYHGRTLSAVLLVGVLEQCILAFNDAAAAGRPATRSTHTAAQVVAFLQKTPGVEASVVAEVELAYLPLLHGEHSPRFLHRQLGESPAYFAKCVEAIFPPDEDRNTEVEPTEEQLSRARRAQDLLDSWTSHPALAAEGGPGEPKLRAWVEEVRALCAANGRVVAGDSVIGRLLAASPPEKDGTWPCLAVRNTIERIPGDIALEAFRTAVFNSQGGTQRAYYEGGDQERDRAKTFQGYADACRSKWPKLAAQLRKLVEYYEYDSRRMDEDADGRV